MRTPDARTFREPEHMDADAADPAALERALSFIRRVNKLLRYNAATLTALQELVDDAGSDPFVASSLRRSVASEPPLSLLDLATGSADLPQEIIAWGWRRGMKIECVGLDRHPVTLAVARAWAPEVSLVRGDALRLPFADGSFDFATCGMFLHHLETDAAVEVIREMERVTRRGWIVADLLRRRRALAWISLFTLFAGPMERHDAKVSVKQAWSPEEARDLARRAGVEARYREVFGHRFLLVRRKPH